MNGNGIDKSSAPGLVVVTGAGGFIGGHLVRALAAAGHRVRAVTRTPTRGVSQGDVMGSSVHWVQHPGVGTDADWRGLLNGAGAVVHLAGLAHMPVDSRQMRTRLREVNVSATRRLATAAATAGVRDFVFMSSIKAVAERSGAAPLDENHASNPEDCYGLAKLAAERGLFRLQRKVPTMRVVVLRPPLVYGPGVGANFSALLGLVRSGMPLPLASVENRRSLLYVGNLAAAVVRCLERRSVASGVFHLSDGASVSTPALVRAIAQAQSHPARLIRVPVGLLTLAARVTGKHAQAARLLGSLEVSNLRFCTSFDWQPPYSLEEGLQATVRDR